MSILRATLTGWADAIPREALPHWLCMFDALTAEQHAYRDFPITDRAWQRWLGCNNKLHVRSTIARLQKATMIKVEGDRVVEIPAVDEVWRNRAEQSEQKRKNRAGKSSSPTSGNDATTQPPLFSTPPPTSKHQEKQSIEMTVVAQSSHDKHLHLHPYPNPHPHKNRCSSPTPPSHAIGDLSTETVASIAPSNANGLGSDFKHSPALSTRHLEMEKSRARPSPELQAQVRGNRH